MKFVGWYTELYYAADVSQIGFSQKINNFNILLPNVKVLCEINKI